MNIFFTDENPVKCAQYLDNSRVIKMATESCQMLSTALHEYGIKGPYKPTHKNHPINIWVRESRENFLWLWEHMDALILEYFFRYGKHHKCSEYQLDLLQGAQIIPSKGLTPKPNCAANKKLGISYKHIDDVYLAYQLYLQERWELDKREPKWG